ncbi:MAG: hypothetical protein QXJ75_00890 [Candidatus Bathyarchaeia archaeon]
MNSVQKKGPQAQPTAGGVSEKTSQVNSKPKRVLIWEELSNEEKLKSLCDAIDGLNNRFDEFQKRANAWSNVVAKDINNIYSLINYNAERANAWSKEVDEKINKIIFQLAARGIFIF